MHRRIKLFGTIGMLILLAASVVLGAHSLAAASRMTAPEEHTFDLSYDFALRELPAGASRIIAWIPVPLSGKWQTMERFAVEPDRPHDMVEEKEYGNRFLRLDLSDLQPEPDGSLQIALDFRVTRRAYHVLDTPEADAEETAGAVLKRFLLPDRLIPIDGKIAEESQRVAGKAGDPLERARMLYDHIVASMSYDKSGEGWGRGDAVYACDVRVGNCTDFHSLFIGETRALGIPSRFIMGLPVPENVSEGAIPGYHCWAEFYVDGRGWIPVDASEARKHPEKREALFGGLDAHRIAFTIGRDIRIPGTSGDLQNYIIYPYVEVDGRPHTKMEVTFFFNEAS